MKKESDDKVYRFIAERPWLLALVLFVCAAYAVTSILGLLRHR